MLSQATVHGVLPATDIERAKKFYGDVLGLKQSDEAVCPGCVAFVAAKGGSFLVYETKAPGAQATALGFQVGDLEAEMKELRARGVEFEEYDFPGLKTVDGVVDMGGVAKAAWFKDSEGNTLSLNQMM